MTDLGSGSSSVVVLCQAIMQAGDREGLAWKELKGIVAEQEIDVLGLGGQVTAHQENVQLGSFKVGLGLRQVVIQEIQQEIILVGSTVGNRIQVWWLTVILDFLGVLCTSKMCSATLFQQ